MFNKRIKINLTALLFAASSAVCAQNVGINNTGTPPDPSAGLDVNFTNRGFLSPRLSTAQMNAIANPATGLQVFNTTTNCLMIFGGVSWQNITCICTGAPSIPSSITGTDTLCVNATGVVYSVPAVAGANSYTWNVPPGATIIAGQGTTSITINFGNFSGYVSVYATNSCGNSGAQTVAITLYPPPASTFTPLTAAINGTTFIPTVQGAAYSWTFASGSPASSASQNPYIIWSTPGTYSVTLTVTRYGCSTTTTDTVTIVFPQNCEAIKLGNSLAASGVYTVSPSTGTMSCYCDMTTDGGGWTLVYRDNHDGIMNQSTTAAIGNVSNLQAVAGPSAKYADNVINALISNPSSTAIGYRTNSTTISNEYFHPSNCVYTHTNTTNNPPPNACMQIITPYTPSPNPSYTQFVFWGGYSAGIDCWYTSNGYTNVVTTSKQNGYTEIGSITTNSSYNTLGSSNTAYGNVLLMWVK